MGSVITIIILVVLSIVLVVSVVWTGTIGAPWEPTTMHMTHKMLQLAQVGADDTVYDLGCGDGRLIVAAARQYGAHAVGIEADPLRYVWCQVLITVLGLHKQVSVRFGNFFSHDLSPATVVTCYLLQETNDKLCPKLCQELSSGTRVVSNTYFFPELEPVQSDGKAHLYHFNLQTPVE